MNDRLTRAKRSGYSIRRRLLYLAAIIVVITLGATGVALDRAYASTIEQTIRERLSSTLSLLLASIDESSDYRLTINAVTDGRLNRAEDNLSAGFNAADYQWLSPSLLGVEPVIIPETRLGRQNFTLRDDFYPGLPEHYTLIWRLLWESGDGTNLPITLWAAANIDEYNQPVRAFRAGLWRWLTGTAILLLTLQLVAGWLSMRPLRTVAREVRAVEQGQMDFLKSNYPDELQPLTDNLNALLHSEREGQQRYRKALGNLAHSIKTPLAVLQNIFDESALTPTQDSTAKSAIDDLHGVMRYQLERAASAARKTLHEPILIEPIARKLCRSMEKVFQDKAIQFDLQIASGTVFYGEERDLLELLGNLLENACKYGNGQIELTAHPVDESKRRSGVRITISDDGAGLTRQQFDAMLQRGVRGDEKVDGHGLGLSIVAEIVDAYSGMISSSTSRQGGLQVTILFEGT